MILHSFGLVTNVTREKTPESKFWFQKDTYTGDVLDLNPHLNFIDQTHLKNKTKQNKQANKQKKPRIKTKETKLLYN